MGISISNPGPDARPAIKELKDQTHVFFLLGILVGILGNIIAMGIWDWKEFVVPTGDSVIILNWTRVIMFLLSLVVLGIFFVVIGRYTKKTIRM